ncbi:late embryogenesis abundant protein 1-like [Rhododendron vialii]|uniref:late embryogenesis abundant protein 1-like n=1 Tax=Rhododendron vialii TaxID=182163 RepID=UPI00265D92CF|nr:late embryogenesis abundant protein 1-like [Rhododendron vialii]
MATEDKIGHMTDNKKQVQEAKDRVYHTAQTAKDGTTEIKNRTVSYLSEKTGAANDKVSAVAQSVKESAQAGRDMTTAVLEKTAVKVKVNDY